MESKLESTPRLRFTDENNEPYPEWEEKKLGDVSDFVNGYAFKSSEYTPNGKYKVVTIKNVTGDKAVQSESCNRLDRLPPNLSFNHRLKIGDILISLTGNVGRVSAVFEENLLLNQRVGLIIPHQNVAKPFILAYLRDRILSHLESQSQGGAQKNISKGDIVNLPLSLPSLPEQEKIGEFLSALDDEVEQAEKLVSLLSDRKRAYTQRIFDRTLRFLDEDGNPYPEWEEKRLGELFSIRSGRNKPHYSTGSFLDLTMGSVSSEGKMILKGRTNDKKDLLHKEEIITPTRGQQKVGWKIIGRTLVIEEDNKYTAGNCTFVLSKTTGEVDSKYASLAINNSRTTRDQIVMSVTGTSQMMINKDPYMSVSIPLPSLPEQEKIGSFLSALDDEIDEAKRELELLKEKKKAYAQRIFGV